MTESVKVYRRGQDRRYRRDTEISPEAGDSLELPLFPGFHLAMADLLG